MTLTDTAPEEKTEEPKAKKPAKKPDPIKAEAAKVDERVPVVTDMVLFSAPQAARDALKANMGLTSMDWAALVTHVWPDGDVSLRVFRPMRLSDEAIARCKYDPDGAPGTWRFVD